MRKYEVQLTIKLLDILYNDYRISFVDMDISEEGELRIFVGPNRKNIPYLKARNFAKIFSGTSAIFLDTPSANGRLLNINPLHNTLTVLQKGETELEEITFNSVYDAIPHLRVDF